MSDFLAHHWRELVEIILTGALILVAGQSLRQTSGLRTLAQIALVVTVMMLVAHLFRLELIRNFALFIGLSLIVVFQPEVRRAVVALGSHRLFSASRENVQLIETVVTAAKQLASKRYGALFAFERGLELDQIAETGIEVDARFTPELVMTLFAPRTSLHDGGMLLRQGRIWSAGCVFPLSQREMNDRSIGLRHRAGIGITEQTDAVSIVVSEETGTISLCVDGKIEQALTTEQLTRRLIALLGGKAAEQKERQRERDAAFPERATSQRINA